MSSLVDRQRFNHILKAQYKKAAANVQALRRCIRLGSVHYHSIPIVEHPE